MDESNSCLTTLIVIPIFLIALIAECLLNGIVLVVLWKWFIVPIFSLPELNIIGAIGISIVVSFLTHQISGPSEERKEKDLKDLWSTLIYSILYSLLALGIGWIVHLFM